METITVSPEDFVHSFKWIFIEQLLCFRKKSLFAMIRTLRKKIDLFWWSLSSSKLELAVNNTEISE